MNNSKAKIYIILLLLGLSSICSCTDLDKAPDDRVVSQFDPDAINIGYLHGSPVRLKNSAALAVLHVNNAGGVLGKQFNIVYNAIGTREETVAKAIPMMDQYDIQTIITTTSSRTLAVLEETKPRQVLLISETATSPTLTDADDDDFLFRTAPSDVHQGKVIAQLAFANNATTAVFVHNQGDSYGIGLEAEFEKEFSRLGGLSVSSVEIPDDVLVGFDQYMPAVYGGEPDVVILSLVQTAVNSNFINETLSQNFQGFYIFPDVAVGSTFTDNIADPSLIDASFGVSPSIGDQQSAHFQYFAAQYLQTFGSQVQNFNANVYDAVIIAALAIEHAGITNNTDVPDGNMIRLSMREIMNPLGEDVGPNDISQAFSFVRNGMAINYSGAYSNNDFDAAGDIVGQLVYDTFSFNLSSASFDLLEQIVIDVPLED